MAREPGRPPAATEAAASFPSGLGPLLGRLLLLCLGSQPGGGTAGLAPAPTPATAAAGGGRRQRLVPSSPHLRPPNRQRRLARPFRVTSRGPWGPTGRARRANKPHSGTHSAGHRRRPFSSRAQRPRAAAKRWVPAAAARPAPSARRSLSRLAGAAPHGACAPRSGLRRRPGAGASRREYASPGNPLGACSI